MVIIEINRNNILVKPLSSQKDAEKQKAYLKLIGYNNLQATYYFQLFFNAFVGEIISSAEFMINLLQQPNFMPYVSAHAHHLDSFVYNHIPLAPLWCDIQIHERASKWGAWAPHSKKAGILAPQSSLP